VPAAGTTQAACRTVLLQQLLSLSSTPPLFQLCCSITQQMQLVHTKQYHISSARCQASRLTCNQLTAVCVPVCVTMSLLLQQEAGLLLWYHCHRGEDGQTEVAGAGVTNSCLATLNSQDATTADKSIAAGAYTAAAGLPGTAAVRNLSCKHPLDSSSSKLGQQTRQSRLCRS
jgi:hypothetical protein